MRFMQWSYPEMLLCPSSYTEIIAEMSQNEAAEAAAARRNR